MNNLVTIILIIASFLLTLLIGVETGVAENKRGDMGTQEQTEGISTVDGYYFVGMIGNRYPIQLTIDFNLSGDSPGKGKFVDVRGEYFYDNSANSERLNITGSYNMENHQLNLREQTKDGKETGGFNGILPINGQAVGEWISGDGKRRLPFKLSRVARSVTWTDYIPATDQATKQPEYEAEQTVENGNDEEYQVINCTVFEDPSMRNTFFSYHEDCRGFEKIINLHFPFSFPEGKEHTISSIRLTYYSDKVISIVTNEYIFTADSPNGSIAFGWEILAKGQGNADWRQIQSWKDLFIVSDRCSDKINGLIYKHLKNYSGNSCVKPVDYWDLLGVAESIDLGPSAISFHYPGGVLGPKVCGYMADVSYGELRACISRKSPLRRFFR